MSVEKSPFSTWSISGPEDGAGDQSAHQVHHHQQDQKNSDGQALGFDKVDIFLEAGGSAPTKAGGDNGGEDIDDAQKENKAIEIGGLEIESGQGEVEERQTHRCSYQKVDQDTAQLALGRLASFYGFITQNNRSFARK